MDRLYEDLESRLAPLLDLISQQEGHPQQVCALYAITNLTSVFSTTEALGVLEHAKQFILKPREEVKTSLESLSYIM